MRKITCLFIFCVLALGLAACKNQPDDMTVPELSDSVIAEAQTPNNSSQTSNPSVTPYEIDENFYAKFIDVSRFEELKNSVESSSDYVANASKIAFQNNMLWNEMIENQSYTLPTDSDIETELERLYGELSRVAKENGVDEGELVECYGLTEDEFIVFAQQQVMDAADEEASQIEE